MKEPGKRRFLDDDWHSFNANGLSDDKMFEAVEGLHGRGVYGAMVTETHCAGCMVVELELPLGCIFKDIDL